MVVRSMRMCVRTVRRPADAFAADIGAWQDCRREPAERRRAGRAGRAHRPRYTVRPPLSAAGRPGTARSADRCADARAVLRSDLGSNRLTGTIGSWISSLAKLTYLYAAPSRSARTWGRAH